MDTKTMNEALEAIFEAFAEREINYANAIFTLELAKTMLIEASLDISEGVPVQ